MVVCGKHLHTILLDIQQLKKAPHLLFPAEIMVCGKLQMIRIGEVAVGDTKAPIQNMWLYI